MTVNRILISQPTPAEQKSPFVQLSEQHDIRVDFRPLICVEGVTLKEFISQRVKILDHTAVIFTSRLLIDNFFRIVGENRVTIPDTMKYFCISEAIALYLQKYIVYRKRKIFFAAGSLTSLMEMILKHGSEQYLVPLSEPYKPEMPLAIERAGLTHSRLILSHTRCADLSDIDPSLYDIVALYSPSEVKNFVTSFVERGYTGKLAVFGEATARAVVEANLRVDLMAPNAKFPSMASALTQYCRLAAEGESLEQFAITTMAEQGHSELLKMAERRKLRTRKPATSSLISKTPRASKSATPRAISKSAASKAIITKK